MLLHCSVVCVGIGVSVGVGVPKNVSLATPGRGTKNSECLRQASGGRPRRVQTGFARNNHVKLMAAMLKYTQANHW